MTTDNATTMTQDESNEIFKAMVDKSGAKMTTTYQPYDEIPEGKDPMSLPMKWEIKVMINGLVHTTPYTAGSAHATYPKTINQKPIPAQFPYYGGNGPVIYQQNLMRAFYTAVLLGRVPSRTLLSRSAMVSRAIDNAPTPPTIYDLMHSLALDASSVEYTATLGEFVDEFGYEDIDAAVQAYEGCKAARDYLVRALGMVGAGEFIEASFYWEGE